MNANVRRPTEDAAIGRTTQHPRRNADAQGLLEALAGCEARRDREGVRLCTAALCGLARPGVAS